MVNEMTEERYINLIEEYAQDRVDFTFNNSRLDHAAIIMAKILDNTKSKVRIYDTSITGDIADQHKMFGESLEKFLKNGKKFMLIVKYSEWSSSKIYQQLLEYSSKYTQQIFVNSIESENIKIPVDKDVNFMVNDTHGYRLELANSIISNRDAICNFNNKKVSNKLIEIFDNLFARSTGNALLPMHDLEHNV